MVATGADFADPLVAGVYAAHPKGALLTTDGAKLSLPTARTLLEMPNLSTTTIFGGPEALTPSVQQSIDTALADIPQIQTLRDFQTQTQQQAKADDQAATAAATDFGTKVNTAANSFTTLVDTVNQNPNTLIADPVNKVADALDARNAERGTGRPHPRRSRHRHPGRTSGDQRLHPQVGRRLHCLQPLPAGRSHRPPLRHPRLRRPARSTTRSRS
ncbi:hypothetical protein ABIA35_005169 [Catenulispora sp. MAP12-49]|uniref:cell wall-binding repeat-containing protein n=1 Tax=Catenulispora sp. MAP12-49 TaxID=3156302 RepID=UPI0035122849